MNMRHCWSVAVLAILAGSALAISPSYVPGEVIVKMKPGYSPTIATSAVGATITAWDPVLGFDRIKLPPTMSVPQAVAFYKSQSSVQYAEPNYLAHLAVDPIVPNDPQYSLQYAPARMNANLAWNFTFGIPSVVVAVIDSGVDYKHEELNAPGKVILGHDYPGTDEDPMDDVGHGTHVAGIIAAAVNNFKGVAGIAGNTTILAIKAADKDGLLNSADIASSIREAADKGADVINMSFGGYGYSLSTDSAVQYALSKNVVLIAAAGNDAADTGTYPFYPAALDGVISVGATDQFDQRAFFSNYGTNVDLAAPGLDVYSTYWVTGNDLNSYAFDSGTSMASPNVAGVAALMISRAGKGTPNTKIDTILLRSYKFIGTWLQRGRVDAYLAVRDVVDPAVKNNLVTKIKPPSNLYPHSGTVSDAQVLGDGKAYSVSAIFRDGTGMVADVVAQFGNLNLNITNLTSAKISLNAKSITGASAMYWLWNYNTSKWDLINNFAIHTDYPSSPILLPVGFSINEFSKYINTATGQVKVRLRSVLPIRFGIQSYNFKVDQIVLQTSEATVN